MDSHWQLYMPVLMNVCERAGKDLEGDLCNVGSLKAASVGVFACPQMESGWPEWLLPAWSVPVAFLLQEESCLLF